MVFVSPYCYRYTPDVINLERETHLCCSTFYSFVLRLCVYCECFDIEVFEDTKEVIRIRKSKKNRQHNGQKKKYKKTNNDLQNTTHKTKDGVTRTLLILSLHIFVLLDSNMPNDPTCAVYISQ